MALFDEERKTLNPQRVEVITPAMAKLLAERFSTKIPNLDYKPRNEPETVRLLLRPFETTNEPVHRAIQASAARC